MRYSVSIDKRLKVPEELASKYWDFPVFVTFQGPIDDENARKFIEGLAGAENAAKQSGQDILPVVIGTNGGDAYACLEMMDAIKSCSVKVATIVEGKAFSAGAFLFSCGAEGHRYMAPNATLMIHPLSMESFGSIGAVKTSTEEGDRLNEKLFKMLSKNCNKPESYFFDKLKSDYFSAEWYLDPKEAVRHNLTNHMKVPFFTVDVGMTYKFGL